jgi:multisubunit Na+/H+ antiporter MnhB subunit
MKLLRTVRYCFPALFRRRLDAEIDEEMGFHLEMAMKANIAEGMSKDEAHHAALSKFGSIDKIKQRARGERGMHWLEYFLHDALFGTRIRAYLTVLAVACLPLGVLWDTSWHISIGRDTFWAPPHIVIQLGGVIPTLLFAWQSANITFRRTVEERAASVCFWGARAPFGAWVTMWGALAMLTSAPFDDWWHNTYGLDVKIVSPPHAVLGLGMFAVALGMSLSVLSWQNRFGRSEQALAWLFTLASGLIVTLLSFYATEFTWPNRQHTSNFYQVISCLYPFLFVAIARASKLRWAATLAAVTYMGIMVALIWMLPLFSAQPKLAPIYISVDHMVPPPFPMLMVVPAFAIDLLLRGSRWKEIRNLSRANTETSIPVVGSAPSFAVSFGRLYRRWLKDWFLAFVVGLTFLLLALAVQWFFAKFLLSPAADNWFFAGNRHWPYYVQPGEWMHTFWSIDNDPVTHKGLAIAAGLAVLSARLGLACGNWMLKVKR